MLWGGVLTPQTPPRVPGLGGTGPLGCVVQPGGASLGLFGLLGWQGGLVFPFQGR